MNCAEAKENIALYIYDELADDAKVRLEHHASHCPACKAELEEALAFKEDMAAYPMAEISPNFLAASRMKLQEALEHAEQQRGWRRFTYDLAGWMHQIKLAPALTAALLIAGFAGGSLTTYRIVDHTARVGPRVDGPSTSEANIAG
ncbi:MAG TPA: zf-HC2 domain-containing protein, partial [Alphaproteobacteria bacterium]|nr:zf-HC2 domain-containing protein [Alphaproteobacteria bacterium]